MCRRTPYLFSNDPDRMDNLETPTIDPLQIHTFKKDQPVADPMMLPKPDNTFRIFAKNPNGISVGDGGTFPIVLEDIQQSEADLYLGPETKLNCNLDWVSRLVQSQCRKILGRNSKLIMAASPIPFPNSHQPGGVMALIHGNNTGRVHSMGSDPLGRWVFIKLNGGGGRQITVIATYQVCKGSIRQAGPTTAITQQYSLLEQRKWQQPHCI